MRISDNAPKDQASADIRGRWGSVKDSFLKAINSTADTTVDLEYQSAVGAEPSSCGSVQGMHVNGGHVAFLYDRRGSNGKLELVSMNGDECSRFLAGALQLVGLVQRLAPSDEDTDWQKWATGMTDCIRLWQSITQTFQQRFLTQGEYMLLCSTCSCAVHAAGQYMQLGNTWQNCLVVLVLQCYTCRQLVGSKKRWH